MEHNRPLDVVRTDIQLINRTVHLLFTMMGRGRYHRRASSYAKQTSLLHFAVPALARAAGERRAQGRDERGAHRRQIVL